jgi:hypothetical protein
MPTTAPPSAPPRPSLLSGIALGAAYGVVLRLAFGAAGHASPVFSWIMTLSFLFLAPLVIGLITVSETKRAGNTSMVAAFFAPWLSIFLTGVVILAFHVEGFACLLFALPIALVGSSMGGILAALLTRQRPAIGRPVLALVALLPCLLAPLEGCIAAPTQIRTVASEIRINASPQIVWQNIGRVPRISPAELRPTWTHRIGFPRPIEATLNYEGVGGVRHGIFERGLVFVEAITAWQPGQGYAFGIKAVSTPVPPTSLDEHVIIGGRYFDLLDGEYRLEPLANGDTLLHLTSRHHLSTTFNLYAGLWTDAVMQNLQSSILDVVRHRCETHPAPPAQITREGSPRETP